MWRSSEPSRGLYRACFTFLYTSVIYPTHILIGSLPLHQVSLCPGRPSVSCASRPAPREPHSQEGRSPLFSKVPACPLQGVCLVPIVMVQQLGFSKIRVCPFLLESFTKRKRLV